MKEIGETSKLRTTEIECLMSEVGKRFDCVEIETYSGIYYVKVKFRRPINAPSFKRTNADRKRTEKENKANEILSQYKFKTLQDLLEAVLETF